MGITGDVGVRAKRRVDFSALRCELPPPPLLYQRPPPLPPPKISKTVVGALSLTAAICLIYLILEQAHVSTRLLLSSSPKHSSFHVFKSNDLTTMINDENGHELESILASASMKDEKTVIITSLNATLAKPSSVFDLFLESLKNGNQTERFIQHLVVVAFDKVAYSRCSALHHDLHCIALTTDGFDFTDEAKYVGAGYRKMMWARINFLHTVLDKGYNFVYTDVDVMWMRDPFERFYPEGDFQIACDVYGNSSTNRHNLAINGGFKYVKSNTRTIELYKYWQAKQHVHLDKPDEDVLSVIKFDSFIDEIGLDMRFLDTAYFGGFCEPSNDLDLVVTMDLNCCTSLDRKLHGMRFVVRDWKRYMRDPMEKKKTTTKMSWTLPRYCGLNHTIITSLKALTVV